MGHICPIRSSVNVHIVRFCRYLSDEISLYGHYNLSVVFPLSCKWEGGDGHMKEPVFTLIISVLAGVISYYICKWFDRD